MALAQPFVIEHQLNFAKRQNQSLDVTMRMPVQQQEVDLVLPNWTPGSYQILEYAAHLSGMQVIGTDGRPLEFRKISKNRWRINSSGETEITVNYSIWAGELSVSTSWVESDFALLNGAGIFLFSESTKAMPQSIRIQMPPEWSRAYTSLPAAGPKLHHFLAKDYDELVDSPFLLGNAPDYPFTVNAQQYVLVNQGQTTLWDGDKSAQDVARLVESVQDFWGINPLQRPYWFLNVIAEGRGGLEHDYSTVLLTNPWQMRYRDDYVQWLALVSHEFFHTWNVRRLRPEALSEYDYENEVYTRELWLAEGLTSYYDNLLLLRAGLLTVDEYFTLLAAEFHTYETTPGKDIRSAESASFDAWIKQYKKDANTVNSVVSYYRKGSLLGFVIDAAIRKESDNQLSLDSMMREMYQRYGPEGSISKGYPRGAFEHLLEEMVGPEVRGQAEKLLSTTEDPDVNSALDWYGLNLDRAPARTAAELAGDLLPTDMGLTWNSEVPGLIVAAVLSGGSGAEAGFIPGDEVLAINGQRVNEKTILDRLLRLGPGEEVEVLVSRHGRILTLDALTQDAVPEKYLITINPDISRKQKQRMTAWLGIQLKFIVR